MRQLHSFLKEMDEEWMRRLHRRHAQEMAARMSLPSGRDSVDGSADVSSRHAVTRRMVSRGRQPRNPVHGAASCASDNDNDNDNEFIFQFVQVVYINTIYEYINQ